MRINFSDEELYDVFEYLADLRESGVTNMWGAGEYVAAAFHWHHDKATKALLTWMKVFSRTKDLDAMVEEALGLLAHEVP